MNLNAICVVISIELPQLYLGMASIMDNATLKDIDVRVPRSNQRVTSF